MTPFHETGASLMAVAGAGKAEGQPPKPEFFSVSLEKLGVLSLFSFGIYPLYWFYWNWKIVRAEHKEDVSPFWRTFFNIFYSHALFTRIRDRRKDIRLAPFAAGPLAAGWIVLNLLWQLPDPYWLVSAFSFIFLLPVQDFVNRLNTLVAPAHEPNAGYSAWNKVLIGVGLVMWIFLAIGLFGSNTSSQPVNEPASKSSRPMVELQHTAPLRVG